MICVSIGLNRHTTIIEQHRHFVEHGAKLVELRLDYIKKAINLDRLVKNRPGPVIVTCRRESDGGQWTEPEDKRVLLLRSAIAQGVDYVDLEEDLAGNIPRFGKTKRIVSYHNLLETPDDLEAIHARLAAKNADVVKLVTAAKSPLDSLRMLRLMGSATVPTIGLCTGEAGVITRLLANRFKAPFTYATFHPKRPFTSGELSYTQVKHVCDYERIGPETGLYAAIGHGFHDEAVPLMYNAAFRELGLDKVCFPLTVALEQFEEFMSLSQTVGFAGLSILDPLQEVAFKFLTKHDGPSRQASAVDTIVYDGEEVGGYNVQSLAYSSNLNAILGVKPGEEMRTDPLQSKKLLVLGSGFAALCAAQVARERGANVILADRNEDRTGMLASRISVRNVDWTRRHDDEPDILINCTPIGQHPDVNESPYDRKYMSRSGVIVESVYHPEQTLLVKEMRQNGCKVVTGVDMALRHAALQFKAFTGQKAPIETLRKELKRTMSVVHE